MRFPYMSTTIALTGPESCGKSWLAVKFSSKYKGTLVTEFSRDYLNCKMGSYEQEDLFIMAEIHHRILLEQAKSDLVVCDTDMLTYYIWNKIKYNDDSDVLRSFWLQTIPDFYLLTYPDIAWQFDPLRESPHQRFTLFNAYLREIQELRCPYAIVTGQGNLRFVNAEFAVLSFISKNT